MNLKTLAAGAIVALFALQSCKKEAQKETEANFDSMNIQAPVPDSANTMQPEAKMTDSSEGPKMFSTVKNKEISLDKDAVTLTSVKEGNTDKAYLVFNDDQSKVEVFMPGDQKGVMYDRKGTEGNYTWTDGKNELIQWKGYVLRTLKQATPLFSGDSM